MVAILMFPKQEWSQGHCSTALGADRVAGDLPGVSTCVLYLEPKLH